MRGLPSGQDLCRHMFSEKMLTKKDIETVIDADFREVVERLGLYDRTPLWLYILLEASVQEQGRRLGTMGSIITVETFRTLVIASRTSILKPGAVWMPKNVKALLGSNSPPDAIPEILKWMDKRHPKIDSIQDDHL